MFTHTESSYLIQAMRDNNVVLFLGAGASYGSKTSGGDQIPLGETLKVFLLDLLGIDDKDLRLDQIAKDVRKFFGDDGLKTKLEEKFLETRPSPEINELFSYRWNRCYTLNYDDTIEGIARHSKKQRHKYYVGTDKIEEVGSADDLQVIHLNGSILRFDKGIVLTDKEFRSRIRKHTPWYEKCASDYASKTFIFIGTRLDEPIFKAYVESIEDVSTFAKSFLVTPGDIPKRDAEDLADLNITVKNNTLADFLVWMKAKASDISDKATPEVNLTMEIGSPEWISKNIDKSAHSAAKLRRNFYAGMYPTWQCVASKWPARLSTMTRTLQSITSIVEENAVGLCLIIGQAGSGKTTCLMHALYNLSSEDNCRTFEFKGESVQELELCLASLNPNSWSNTRCIIWISDFQIYADEIERIARTAKSKGAIVLGELRSSDWSGRFFGKHKEATKVITMTKLVEKDYEELASAIQEFATAPEFRRLPKTEQVRQLKKIEKSVANTHVRGDKTATIRGDYRERVLFNSG